MRTKYLLAILSVISYILLGYFIAREQFSTLTLIYSGLFLCFYYFCKQTNNENHFIFFIKLGIFFRVLFIFSIPILSNDYNRFIWDGQLINLGINPYQYYPTEIIKLNQSNLINNIDILYKGMGEISRTNYTIYPPINQFFFFVSTFFSKNLLINIIVMRVIFIVSDLVTMFYSIKILNLLKIDKFKSLIYFLNPFIIIELTGNLHFEAIMIMFLIIALYFLIKNKIFLSALFLSFSISIKLIPLIFLPLLFRFLGVKKSIYYYLITFSFLFIYFIPFYNPDLINNFTQSINLYFKKFEFNASIYYLVREYGYWKYGYNIIGTAGKYLSLIVFFTVISFSIFSKKGNPNTLINLMLISLSVHFFMTTTIHPWYISTLVIISIFTNFRYPIIWSFLIVFSYNAYQYDVYNENLFFNVLTYSIVYLYFSLDLMNYFKIKSKSLLK